MKLEIDIQRITTHTKCNHGAYEDTCLCCMYAYAISQNKEISESGLEITIKKHKKAGDFL